MTASSRLSHSSASLAALALLVGSVCPGAVIAQTSGTTRKAPRTGAAQLRPTQSRATQARVTQSRAASSGAMASSQDIIALPLNPVVPTAQRTCANRTPTGLGYTMLRTAAGPTPAATDVVLVNYIGYLAATGVVFDQGMRSPLPIAGVIPGFAQALQMIGRSGVGRFCIPASLGYGAEASGPIPANADLVFQVELLDYKTAAEIESMNKARTPEPTVPEAAPKQP